MLLSQPEIAKMEDVLEDVVSYGKLVGKLVTRCRRGVATQRGKIKA